MKRYKSSAPRAAFAVAAVAMTVITIAVSIVVPATMDSGLSRLDALVQLNGIAPMAVAARNGFERSDATADCAPSSGSVHQGS